jgi:hypothetical protein
MTLHGTHNPALAVSSDGRAWCGYGSGVARICRVAGSKLMNEQTIDAADAGRPSLVRPNVWTHVRDTGERCELTLAELDGRLPPRVVGRVAPGVPFYARDGHWLTNQPKVQTVTRDAGTATELVVTKAVLGRIDGDDLYFVDGGTRLAINRWRGGLVTVVGMAPSRWAQGIGMFDVCRGRWVIGNSGGGELLDDTGRSCKVTPYPNGREGSLVLFRFAGAVWMATAYQPPGGEAVYWIALRPIADTACLIAQRNGAYLDARESAQGDLMVVSGPPTGTGLVLDRWTAQDARIIPTLKAPGPSPVGPPIIPPVIPPEPPGGSVAFENMYDELVAVSKTSANWAKALSVAPTSPERLEACKAFCNESAWTFNAADNITAGDKGSYGMLWRGSKGSVSDDCLAIIGSDGKTYESDIIRDVDGPNITIQWSSPVLSQWTYQAPTPPSTTPVPPNPNPEPNPEPEPMPTGPYAPYSTIPHDVPDNPEHGWEFWLDQYFAGSAGYPPESIDLYRSQAFDAWRRSMQAQITARGQYPDGGWNTPGSSEDWMKLSDEAGKAMHVELNTRP